MTGVLIKERKRHKMLINRQKATWGCSEKAAISKPRREVLGKTQFAKTLILDLQPHYSICNICLHTHTHTHIYTYRLPRWLSGKEATWQAGEVGLIPGSGRCPWEGNGKPKYSCLRNPMNRGAWYTHTHTHTHTHIYIYTYTYLI